jgi:hypothetical protein
VKFLDYNADVPPCKSVSAPRGKTAGPAASPRRTRPRPAGSREPFGQPRSGDPGARGHSCPSGET